MAFQVTSSFRDRETLVVSVHGDVDPLTAPEFEKELLEAAVSGAGCVLVDLTETTLFGSSAIHVLVRGAERLRSSGVRVGVVCANPTVMKVLQITGVDHDLRIFASVEQAGSLTASGNLARPGLRRFDPAAADSYA